MPMASRYNGVEMFEKGRASPMYAQTSRPMSRASDSYETEFEDDDPSDLEEYAGRKSEDSVGYTVAFAEKSLSNRERDSLVIEAMQPSLPLKNCTHPPHIISIASTFNYRSTKSLGQQSLLKDR